MPRPTQTARQRELFRYFQPPPPPVHDSSDPAILRSSNDLSLTAFAQLGALRLNAVRGIISLVGRDTEYVIAEAGKTISLQNDNRHARGDELWYGVGPLQSSAALGLLVIDILAGISPDSIPYLVVNDLRKDDRFSHLPIVTEKPSARFLACFPLQTPAGYLIGLYTIIDDQPRELSHPEVQFLRDMARTAMDHIESGRVKQQHHRAERMVKALGIFLEGGDSLRNWWLNQGRDGQNAQQVIINANVRRGLSYSQQADEEFGVQDLPDRNSGTFGFKSSVGVPHDAQSRSFRSIQSVPGDGRPPLPRSESNSTGTAPLTATGSDFTLHVEQESATDESSMSPGKVRHEYPPGTPLNADFQKRSSTIGKRFKEAFLSKELKSIFARASNLVREAIDASGVAFFDASIGSSGAASERINREAKAPGVLTFEYQVDNTASSSEEEKRRTSDTDASDADPSALPSEKYVGILGYSTRTRSSMNKHSVPEAHEFFPESLLRQLAKSYPHGRIFSFDEEGTMSSSDTDKMSHADSKATSRLETPLDESDMRRKKRRRLTLEEAAAGILKVVPEARSVAWFPLWDSSLERWYAGTLIWSKSATRVFSPEEELTYMATFSNSIMAEVSRLSAVVASQMKVDFISSISHELRSPLHGILACVEFLRDDQGNSSVSEDMVNTINNCGHTLLHTIDHVLDFAKITQKVGEKSSHSRTKRHLHDGIRPRRREMSNGRPIDLRILTEEVIDSVYAGRRAWTAKATPKPSDTLHHTSHPAPAIIVDISWRENWTFDMDDGAWRRILMNLFSNAVKYTSRGYVRVALNVELDDIPGKKKPYPRLCLEVSDSGQGISQEFLNNHIYTAFKQEDALSIGTGLGLSIVRQIILDLGGKIDIKSEVRVGTKAYVSIPLLPKKVQNLKEEDAVGEVRKIVAGSRACLVNSAFDLLPAISEAPSGILSPEAEALMLLKSSIRSTLTDWFGMEVVTSSKLDLACANIHITTSSEISDIDIHTAKFDSSGLGPIMVIVICSSLSRTSNYVTEGGVQVFYIQQPVSPQKIATALSQTTYRLSTPTQNASIIPSETQSSSIEVNGILPDGSTPTGTVDSPSTTLEPTLPSTVPRSLPTRHASYSAASSPAPTQLPRVLLVEDNEINLSLLVKCVSKLQHPFVTATNGLEAVEAFKFSGPFDVVVLDIQMPVMDGFEAAREIRIMERKEGKISRVGTRGEEQEGSGKKYGVTIIALTGASSAMAKQEAFASGIDLFLVKPVSMKALRDVLSDINAGGRNQPSKVTEGK